jgi:parallel beta-helix repeat protein
LLRNNDFNNFTNNILSITSGSGDRNIYLYFYNDGNYFSNNTAVNTISSGSCVEVRSSCLNNIFYNNTVSWLTSSSEGFYITGNCPGTQILNNTIFCTDHFQLSSIYITGSPDVIIADNTIYGGGNSGISIWSGSTNVVLSNNQLYFSSIAMLGSLADFQSYNVYPNNTVNDKPVYFYVSQSDLSTEDFQNAGQIFLVDCTNVEIFDLTISDVNTGIGPVGLSHAVITLHSTTYSILSNITLTNCTKGIYLDEISNYNSIYGCSITQNTLGIILDDDSDHNNVSDSNLFSGKSYGGYLPVGIQIENDCQFNLIQSNNVYDNYVGMNFFGGCSENIIRNNTVFDNSNVGIRLYCRK